MNDREAALATLRQYHSFHSKGDTIDHLLPLKTFAELVEGVDPEVIGLIDQAERCVTILYWDLLDELRDKVGNRFMKTLRGLVKEGLVSAHWTGFSPGGRWEENALPTKVRVYNLKRSTRFLDNLQRNQQDPH